MEIQSIPISVNASNSIPRPPLNSNSINRRDFAPDFIFGVGTSAYQVEGAAKEGGKGPSVWDFWTWRHPDIIAEGSNGNMTVDFYHRYKEDVSIMRKMGLDSCRFSIAWSRILPYGKLCYGVNKEGINFYNNLIDELLANGIKPFVTIFHWDLPQALQDEYGGFLSRQIVDDFCDYANLCFLEFGDRVKHWSTLNEPLMYSSRGYANKSCPPGRGSSLTTTTNPPPAPTTLPLPITSLPLILPPETPQPNIAILPAENNGDPGREPYLVGHHLLLAHAAAVEMYRNKYQAYQKGKIGITLNTHFFEPFSDHYNDKKAAERALDFNLGWFLNPVVNGHYPESMQSNVIGRLPHFTFEESKKLKESFDFIGVNYYTSRYAKDDPQAGKGQRPSYNTDSKVEQLSEREKIPIGPQARPVWLNIYPEGLYKLLIHIKNTYKNPLVYITENGVAEKNDANIMLPEALNDTTRKYYIDHHLRVLRDAIHMGANVKGYFVWSFLDSFEWNDGYTNRFGMIYIDFKDDLKRYWKESAIWFMNFLKKSKKRSLDSNERDNAATVTKKTIG